MKKKKGKGGRPTKRMKEFKAQNKPAFIQILTQIFAGKICPYCNQSTEYIDSSYVYGKSYGMIYICKKCDAYCGVHKGTDKALGRVANAELRELKKLAHATFDPIWQSNMKSRHEAYWWLSNQLNIPKEYTHIGFFGVETCKKVIKICKFELQ